MILIALILAACGAILSHWLRVFILIPASLVVWGIAIVFAWMHSFSILQSIATGFLFSACLQFGYLGGAAVGYLHAAHRKRRSVMTVH